MNWKRHVECSSKTGKICLHNVQENTWISILSWYILQEAFCILYFINLISLNKMWINMK